jgi:beta-lactamase regulating signal transducer with metallopeptidase domain
MTTDINAMMLAVSGSQAASVVVKATAIAAAALAGARLASGSRAAVRHALLAVAFGALAVLPLVTLAAPPIRIALRMAAQKELPVVSVPVGEAVAVSTEELREVPVKAPAARLTPATTIAAAWMAGAALFLLPVLVGLRQVRRLRRTGLPWRQGQEMAETLAAETGARRRVEVLLHEELAGPMMCGALRPAVVLPLDARNWMDEDVKRALVHEMEHARRGDWFTYCFARVVRATLARHGPG